MVIVERWLWLWRGDGGCGEKGQGLEVKEGMTSEEETGGKVSEGGRGKTYGSPMTKLSPALIDGTRPSEPTSAAAASLCGR